MPRRSSMPRWGHLLLFLAFLVVGLVHTPGLFRDAISFGEDAGEYIPLRLEAARAWRHHEFPFFTDAWFGGMPLHAVAFAGVLYPPNLLYLLAKPIRAANLLQLFHTMAGCWGMWMYLRSYRVRPLAAFAGALLFINGTFLVCHIPHICMREAALLAPWVAWAARRLLRRPSAGAAAVLSGVMALQFLTGYAQVSLITMGWIGVEVLATPMSWRQVPRRLGALLVAGMVFGLLVAAQVLPTLEHVPNTPRATVSEAERLDLSFPPENLLTLVDPFVAGTPLGGWTRPRLGSETLITLSPAASVLALAGLVLTWQRRRRGPRARWSAALLLGTVLSALLAFGAYFPPAASLLGGFPFSLFRIPARWLLLACCFLPALAARGVEELLSLPPGRAAVRAVAAWIGLAVVLLAIQPWLAPDAPPWHRPDGREALAAIVLPAAMLAVLLGVARRAPPLAAATALLVAAGEARTYYPAIAIPPQKYTESFQYRRNPLFSQVPRENIGLLRVITPTIGFLDPVATRGGSHSFLGLRALSGSSPLLHRHLPGWFGISQNGPGWRDREAFLNPQGLGILGVTHFVVDLQGFPPDMQARLDAGQDYDVVAQWQSLRLLALRHPMPRHDFAPSWNDLQLAGPHEEWKFEWRLWHDDMPLGQRFVALENFHDPTFRAAGKPLGQGTARRLDEGFQNRMTFRVKTTGKALFLVRDVWWPGWKYRITPKVGPPREGDVLRADGLIRAVPLPKGTSIVEMWYEQPGWKTGSRLSLLGLLIWFLLAAWGLVAPIVGRASSATP